MRSVADALFVVSLFLTPAVVVLGGLMLAWRPRRSSRPLRHMPQRAPA
jgi:hypothetical protein